jgi:phosphoglycerate dehydrogenase-like enzyme
LAGIDGPATVRYVDAAGLTDALGDSDALLVWDFASMAVGAVWPAEHRLRWVHVASAGVDRLLFPELLNSDVTLTNSRGIFDRSIAEYVLGLVLLYAKDLATTVRLQDRRSWQHRDTEVISGRDVLVVGAGPIGCHIADLLTSAGMTVRLVARTPRGNVAGIDQLPALLPAADYVVLSAPLTPASRGLLDEAAFGRMKPGARLINVGRGELVEEAALISALREGRIAGAALDVFAAEPLDPSSPLWSLPGVLISPHMSADFIGWHDALAALFVDNFHRWVAGKPLRNVVDKQLGYVPSREVFPS